MLVSGLGNVAGLFLEYSALRRGKVGIVTPVTSTEGAIAAVLAVAAGEALGVAPGGLLAIVALGVVLAGVAPEEPTSDQRRSGAFWLAVLAALSFGIGIFANGSSQRVAPRRLGGAAAAPRRRGGRDDPTGDDPATQARSIGTPSGGVHRARRGARFRLLRCRRA